MRKDSRQLWIRKACVMMAVFLFAVTCIVVNRPATYEAKPVKPFKVLKIGSKNFTKAANREYSSFSYEGPFDGGSELYGGLFRGTMKKGSRLQIKLKKGYRAVITYEGWGKAKCKAKRVKNHFRIPTSSEDWVIYINVKRGKKTGYFMITPGYPSEWEEWEEED